MEPPPSSPKNVRPVHSWAASLRCKLVAAWNHGHPVRSEIPFAVSLLKIDGADTRREHKLTAGVSLIR